MLTLTLEPARQAERPQRRADRRRCYALLERADLDADVRVVVLRGAGKDFCAGADLDELLASADRPLAENETTALRLGGLFGRMRALPKPVVAVVHGRALAGGCGPGHGVRPRDRRRRARSSAIPRSSAASCPAMVMTLLRRAAGEKIALDLVAHRAGCWAPRKRGALGLVSRVVPDAELDREAGALARSLAAASPTALALTKQLFYQLDGRSVEEGVALGARINALARQTPDFRAAIARFLER